MSSGGSASRGSARVGNRSSEAVQVRLAARGLRVDSRVTDDGDDCVEHSYGRIQEFLRANPCVGLHRAMIVIRDRNGDIALVAVAWAEMADESAARELERLLDTPGTGNIIELSRERGRYRSVRYSGPAYASRRDGPVVVSAQAEPVARGWAGPTLTSLVQDAVR